MLQCAKVSGEYKLDMQKVSSFSCFRRKPWLYDDSVNTLCLMAFLILIIANCICLEKNLTIFSQSVIEKWKLNYNYNWFKF